MRTTVGTVTLSLIVGPPNSGRTGAVLEGFRAALARDPVLVVPTLDDVERFERELTAGEGAVLGATVCNFERLFGLVANATGLLGRPSLSPVQRRQVVREAVERAPALRLLAASAKQAGFAPALDDLIGDLQSALVDPATLRQRAGEAGPYEAEIASLYSSYCAVRDELGLADAHSLAVAAIAALRAHPETWAARPVFLYGFDDLSVEQLELVRELSRAASVTVALPWEDRAVLTDARGRLFSELRETGAVATTELEPDPSNTASRTLYELERRFGEPPGSGEAIANDGGLALLASAGELAESESVGSEVARLLDGGVPAGEVAIVLRQPERQGPLYRLVLERFGIPAAVQADLDVTRTLTGAGLLALLEAAVGRRRASDVLAYLRTPGIESPSRVDWFERRLRRGRMRSADEALDDWHEGDRRELREVERLRAAAAGSELLLEAARQARWIAEGAVRGQGAPPGEDRSLELRAGAEIERCLLELADLSLPMDAGQLVSVLGELTVPLWRGPTEGRVRVISPYRARARRVRHMFICSLQDGEFPRRDTGGGLLLSDEARAALALRPRVNAELEDRYLFALALSRPQEKLWLSWRSADDEGKATSRSPFVDRVRELLDPPLPEGLEERDEALSAEASGRGLGESVFALGRAPSRDELARSLAARVGHSPGAPADGDGDGLATLEPEARERIAARLATAAEQAAPERLKPGPLAVPAVLEGMRSKRVFGPSTLERYAECPYRWFVDHELQPKRIDPDDATMTAGQVAHRVLERLYRDQPGDQPRPTPATLDAWRRRASELVGELGDRALPRDHPDTAATLRRVEGLVLAFLADEASASVPFLPDPKLAEAGFGFDDDDRPALPIAEGAGIHGRIDRIDIGPNGEALVQDYKSGKKVDGGREMAGRGKLQLQLYLLAVRELWELELAGGLYRALGATNDAARRPHGLLRKQLQGELEDLGPRPNDHLADEDFELALAEARDQAAGIATAIQAGEIGRRPLGGRCPPYCGFQPICRRERGLPDEEPGTEEDSEE